MSKLIELRTHGDERGDLTVIEKEISFDVKRVFYIYNTKTDIVRGGHRHKKTIQAVIAIGGSCSIYINNGVDEYKVILDTPTKMLLLAPEDWHTMQNFTDDCILLVLASEYYDAEDYIFEGYSKND